MNQIKAGSIISYIQTALNVLITLLYTPIMIRLLGRSEYGLYNTVSSVISILALLNLGFGSTYIKYYATYKTQNVPDAIKKLNGMFMSIFLCIGLVAGLCGFFLANNLTLVFSNGLTGEEYRIAKYLMLILTFNLMLSFPANVFSCIITAHEKFVFLKLLGTIKLVVSPLVTLPVLLAGYGSMGMVMITAVLSVISDAIYAFYVFSKLKEKFVFKGFDKQVFKEIFAYTLLIAVHIIADQVNWNVDKVLLGRFRGTDEVAVYSVGFSLYAHYITIGLTIVNMFTPRVHKIVAETGDTHMLTNRLTNLFTKIGRIQYLVLAVIASGFIFFGKPFITFWTGAEYADAYYVALLLIIPGTIDIIQNIGIEIQRSQRLHAFRAMIDIVMAFINIIISIFLCQLYGAVGSAVGTAISLLVVQGIIMNVHFYKKCHINVLAFWKSILQMSKGLVLPILFGILIRCVKNHLTVTELLICIMLYALIYAVSVFFLGLEAYEKDGILKMLKKLKLRKRVS